MPSLLKAASTMSNTSPITLAPGFPIPFVFDVQERFQQLRSYLEPGNPMYIHTSLSHRGGRIDGLQQVYIVNGEAVAREMALNRMTWPGQRFFFYASLQILV
jgi:hypothetical protein